jgi:hypothetical protein
MADEAPQDELPAFGSQLSAFSQNAVTIGRALRRATAETYIQMRNCLSTAEAQN